MTITAPKTAVQQNFDAAEWMGSRDQHHIFRLTLTCPGCGARWCQDITDHPDRFEIPDRRALGLAMLCGGCEAQRITRYVVRGKGKAEWSAPFFGEDRISEAWGRLKAVPNPGTSWVTVEGLGPAGDNAKRLRDDRRDVMRSILVRKVNEYRGERVTCFDASQLGAAGLDWKIPDAPRRDADGW